MALQCAGATTRAPFYSASVRRDLSSQWEMKIQEIGYVGPVGDRWWGERFFRITVEVSNRSELYRFLKLDGEKLGRYNFNYVMSRNPELKKLYEAQPDSFDLQSFTNEGPALELIVALQPGNAAPNASYRGQEVFPSRGQRAGLQLYAAAMLASKFGIPLRGAVVDRSQNSTGWLAPGASRVLQVHFSVPTGCTPVQLKMEGILDIDLEEAPAPPR